MLLNAIWNLTNTGGAAIDPYAPVPILSITDAGGGDALVTFTRPHGLSPDFNWWLLIAGNSYAGWYLVVGGNIATGTTLLLSNDAYVADATSGTGVAPAPTTAPTGLEATSNAPTSATVSWTTEPAHITSVDVTASLTSGGTQVTNVTAQPGDLGGGFDSLGDYAQPPATFYFKARSFNGDRGGPYSAEVNATTPAYSHGIVSITQDGDGNTQMDTIDPVFPLIDGQYITLHGTEGGLYDGVVAFVGGVGGNTFFLLTDNNGNTPIPYVGDSTGGTWELV